MVLEPYQCGLSEILCLHVICTENHERQIEHIKTTNTQWSPKIDSKRNQIDSIFLIFDIQTQPSQLESKDAILISFHPLARLDSSCCQWPNHGSLLRQELQDQSCHLQVQRHLETVSNMVQRYSSLTELD